MLFTTTLAVSSILSLGLGASASPLQRRDSLTDPTPKWCAPSVYGYNTLISASQATRAKWFPDGELDGHFSNVIVRDLGTDAPEDEIPYWSIDVGDDERGTVRIKDPKSGACIVVDHWGATLAGGVCGDKEGTSEWWLNCASCDIDTGVATQCLFQSAYESRCAGYNPAEGQATELQSCDNRGLSYPNPQTQYWDLGFIETD